MSTHSPLERAWYAASRPIRRALCWRPTRRTSNAPTAPTPEA